MVYFIFILCFICLGMFISLSKEYNYIFSVILLFFVSIFIGLRDPDIGQDTKIYIDIFNNPDRYTEYMELVFLFFVKFIKLFTNTESVYLVTHAFITNIIIYFAYRQIVGKFAIYAMGLFSCTHIFWIIHFQLLRNGLAASILILAIVFLLKSRKYFFYFLSAISASIHHFSVVPILAIYISSQYKGLLLDIKKIIYIFAFILFLILGLFLLQNFIFEFFNAYIKKIEGNIYYSDNGMMQKSTVNFAYIHTIMLFLISIYSWPSIDMYYKKIFIVYSCLVIVSCFFWFNLLFKDRALLYAQILEPVLFVYIFYNKKYTQIIHGYYVLACLGLTYIIWASGVFFIWGERNILTGY